MICQVWGPDTQSTLVPMDARMTHATGDALGAQWLSGNGSGLRSKSCWFLVASTFKLLTTLVSTGSRLNVFKPLMALAAVSSKAVVLLMLIRC